MHLKRNFILVHINGNAHQISGDEAFLPLATYLRKTIHQPGTKIVCAEGDCGACSVLVSKFEQEGFSSFRTINSCIAPVFLFDLCVLVTVEGLQEDEDLSEVQVKMREFHGGQCGFCTPGMVCSLAQLADDCKSEQKPVTEKKARNYLTGNLCRCTGYEPILKAATNFELDKWTPLAKRYLTESCLMAFTKESGTAVRIQGEDKSLQMPTVLAEAIALKSKTPDMRIIAGATDIGVVINKARSQHQDVLVLNKIADLAKVETLANGIFIGAQVSLTDVETFVRKSHPELKRLLHIFASPQIKNQGTLLGNILNGSPIGDSIPALLALEAEIQFVSAKGTRAAPITEFYKAYKVFDKTPDEIATGIFIPNLQGTWLTKFYKVSVRKDLDISAVTFAACLKMDGDKIQEARIAMGGVGPCVIRLPQVEKLMVGHSLSAAIFEQAGLLASSLITPISDLRASQEYRSLVTKNLFKKCHLELTTEKTPTEELVCP
jgi:xanthine dehydrogenase small subunit